MLLCNSATLIVSALHHNRSFPHWHQGILICFVFKAGLTIYQGLKIKSKVAVFFRHSALYVQQGQVNSWYFYTVRHALFFLWESVHYCGYSCGITVAWDHAAVARTEHRCRWGHVTPRTCRSMLLLSLLLFLLQPTRKVARINLCVLSAIEALRHVVHGRISGRRPVLRFCPRGRVVATWTARWSFWHGEIWRGGWKWGQAGSGRTGRVSALLLAQRHVLQPAVYLVEWLKRGICNH